MGEALNIVSEKSPLARMATGIGTAATALAITGCGTVLGQSPEQPPAPTPVICELEAWGQYEKDPRFGEGGDQASAKGDHRSIFLDASRVPLGNLLKIDLGSADNPDQWSAGPAHVTQAMQKGGIARDILGSDLVVTATVYQASNTGCDPAAVAPVTFTHPTESRETLQRNGAIVELPWRREQ